MQRNLATKIWAKRESSLTAVRLKQDPPVLAESVEKAITAVPKFTLIGKTKILCKATMMKEITCTC